MHFFLLIAFLIAVAFITVAFQNPDPVSLEFITWSLNEPLALVLAVPFAAGLLVGLFLLIPVWWRKAKLARSQKKRIKELESEIEQPATMQSESDEGVETDKTETIPEKEEGFD